MDELDHALHDEYDNRGALTKFFGKWGHVVAAEVVLGGERRLFAENINVTDEKEAEIRNNLEKILGSLVLDPVLNQNSNNKSEHFNGRISTKIIGGDSQPHGSLIEWLRSLCNCG